MEEQSLRKAVYARGSAQFELVPATLEHGPAISQLAASINGKTGRFGFHLSLCGDAFEIFSRHPDCRGLVALTRDGQVVGYHFRRFLSILINNEKVKSVLGFNLYVHPEYRRQGIGSEIYQAVFKDCMDNGIDLFFGEIEERNVPSKRQCQKNGYVQVREQIRAMVTTRRLRPHLPPGLEIAPVDDSELCRWAEGANAFYRLHDFWQPLSVDLLKTWLSPANKGCKRRLYAAKDAEGQLLAGLGIDDCSQLFTWVVERVPQPARVLGRLMRIMDKGGRVPFARVIILWYRNGNAGVARLLWEWIRWELRQDVRLIVIFYDPLSPMREAVHGSLYLPKTKSIRVARLFRDIQINTDRPIGTEFI
jgi:GNAT superfamily N-acetyltransferase